MIPREEYDYRRHQIIVACEERGANLDPHWRVSILKNGEFKAHQTSSKPYPAFEQAISEGKAWAENWVDSN